MEGAQESLRKQKTISRDIKHASNDLNLTALPREVLFCILAFCTQQDLLRARLVNSQFKDILSCLHFVSTRDALQQLFIGQLDKLLVTHSICPSAHSPIVQDLLSDHAFRDFLSQHREKDPVTCGRHALLHGFRKYCGLKRRPGETHRKLLKRIRVCCKRKRPEWELNSHFRDHGLPRRFGHYYISADIWRYVMPDPRREALLADALRHWNIEAAIDFLHRKFDAVGPTFCDMKGPLFWKLPDFTRAITKHFLDFPNATLKLVMSPDIRLNGQCTQPYYPIDIYDIYKGELKDALYDQLQSGSLTLQLPHVQLVCWILLAHDDRAVKLLINHPASNLSLYHHYPLLQYLTTRHEYDPDTYRKIVYDPRIDLASVGITILENVVIGADLELAEYLLHHPKVNLPPQGGELVLFALNSEDHQIMQLILDDPRIDPHAKDDEFFYEWLCFVRLNDQSMKTLQFLLKHPRVDSNSLHWMFRLEFLDGLNRHPLPVLDFFVSVLGVDPGAENNEALKKLLSFEFVETPVLEWFLNHPKVDPGANDNEIFVDMVMKPYTGLKAVITVETLLACPRIDPSARDNAAFFYVFSKLYPKFKLDYLQYRSASYKFPSSHLDLETINSFENYYIYVGRLLLEDGRVMDKLRLKYPDWDTYGINGSVLDESVYEMAEVPYWYYY